jgi:hypothetical protein
MQRTHSSLIAGLAAATLVMALLVFATPARAQETSDASAKQEEINKELLEKIDKLEKEIEELKAQEAQAAAAAATAAAPAPAPAPAAPAEPPPVVETPKVHAVADRLRLGVYGDVGYQATDLKGVSNTFEFGSLDLFMTARLSSKVSLLGEVLFTPDPGDNTISPDVERLLLTYRPNDYFSFGVGRYHTSIGYYNTAFHRGAWFETAIGRPYMYDYDDQGGVLPLQEVGVTTSGNIPSGKLGLNYVAEIGNGRDHTYGSEPVQNAQDFNNGKAVNVAINADPGWVPGLEAGFSFYHDNLTFPDNIDHSELISAAHVVFNSDNYEILNEGLLVRHEGSLTGAPGTFYTSAYYTQFSRKFGAYRPYFRYQYFNAPADDPVFGNAANSNDGSVIGRLNGPSVGIRWDFNSHAAFKLQYDHFYQRGFSTYNNLDSQFAFTF